MLGSDGSNVCQLPDDVTCASTDDCPGKQLCAGDGQCRDSCAAASECVAMQSCATQGVCAEAAEVDPMGNLRNAGGAAGAGQGGAGAQAGAGAGTGGTSAGAGGAGAAGGTSAGQGGASAGQGGASAGQGGASGAAGTGGCEANFADCDKNGSCETNLTALTSCGACGVSCSAPNTVTTSCDAGSCKINECKAGFTDCDTDPKTGCEANTGSDSNHCGSCERDCLGGACATGLCGGVLVAEFSKNSLAAVAATDNHVFAVQFYSNPSLMRFAMEPTTESLAGKAIRTLIDPTGVAPRVDGDSIYWTEHGNPSNFFKYPSDGSDIAVVPFFTTLTKPSGLQVTPSAFYWFDTKSSTKGIYTRAKDGSGQDIVVLTRDKVSAITTLVIGPSHLAWVEQTGTKYELWRSKLDGQDPELVDGTLDAKVGTTVTPTDLYYTIHKVGTNGAVMRQAWADPVGPKTVALFNQPYAVHAEGASFLVQVDGGTDARSVFRMQPDGTSVKIAKVSSLGYLYPPVGKFSIFRPDPQGSLYRLAH